MRRRRLGLFRAQDVHELCKTKVSGAQANKRKDLTGMGHVLVTFDTALHSQPTTLKGMCAPDIPVLVRKLLPVDLTVIIDFQRVNSANKLETVFEDVRRGY